MSQRWKVALIVVAVAGIVSTPLVWLLNSPGTGEMTGASVQAAVGVLALWWAVFQQPPGTGGPEDRAVRTGPASRGGVSGIRRPGGRGSGSATAEDTGEATCNGTSGIDYTE